MANAGENKGAQPGSEKKAESNTDVELIKAQLEQLREDLSSLGEMVGMTARERYASAREDLVRNAETTRAQAADQLTATLNDAEDTVRRNPLTALAIVLGIGYLFGLFSRK